MSAPPPRSPARKRRGPLARLVRRVLGKKKRRAGGKRRKGDGPCEQLGALAWRRGEDLQVLLVTSRENKRWIIPKGWPMHDRPAHRAAEQEALEEAGVVGEIGAAAVGSYRYNKRLKSGKTRLCTVQVFPLRVTKEKSRWLERGERERRWFAPHEAAELVEEPELSQLIIDFAAALTRRPTATRH